MSKKKQISSLIFPSIAILGIALGVATLHMSFNHLTEASGSNQAFPGLLTDKELSNAGVLCSEAYGVRGKGCYFNNNAIDIGTKVTEQLSASEGTVMMWINPQNLTARQYPFWGIGQPEINRYYIQIEPPLPNLGIGSRIRLFRGNNEERTNVDLIQNPSVNTWYHVAMTWEQEDADTLRLYGYLDGELIGTGTFKGTILQGRYFLGGNGSQERFVGYIDEPQLHKRALTPDEIQAHIDEIFPPEVEEEEIDNTDIFPNFMNDKELNVQGVSCSRDYGVVGRGCFFQEASIDISSKANSMLTGDEGTVMMWLNPQEYSVRQYPFWGIAQPGVNRFYLQIEPARDDLGIGHRLRFFRGNNTERAAVDLAENPDTNTWYHLAMTWRHLGDEQMELKGYLDGELIGTRTFQGRNLNGTFYLGGNGNTEKYIGYIDEPQLHGRALTETEIFDYHKSTTPYREIFTLVRNDMTNLHSVKQVGNTVTPRTEPLTQEYLRASYRQMLVEGVDAIALNTAVGWVPYWKTGNCNPAYGAISSNPYQDLADHTTWWRSLTSRTDYPNIYSEFILNGNTNICNNENDLVDILIEEASERNISTIMSFSLNDHQGFAKMLQEDLFGARNVAVNKFSYDIYWDPVRREQFLIDPSSTNERFLVHNWEVEEARQFKLDLIQSVIQNYDIDGIDLNFMRFPLFFPEDRRINGARTTYQAMIMKDFINSVHEMIEEKKALTGHDMMLFVTLSDQDSVNRDIPIIYSTLKPEQIDYVILQSFFYDYMPEDVEKIRGEINKDIKMLYTFMHAVGELYEPDGFLINSGIEYKNNHSMMKAMAYLTYNQGVDGYALFNFPYYEEYGRNTEIRGPWNIPPYDILSMIKNSRDIERITDVTYYIGAQHKPYGATMTPQLHRRNNVTKILSQSDRNLELYFNTMSPRNGWQNNGVLKLISNKDLSNKSFSVRFNNQVLQEITNYTPKDDIFNPVPRPYQPGIDTELDGSTCMQYSECYRYFLIPKNIMRDGFYKNLFLLRVNSTDEPFSIMYADISFE